MKVGILTHYNVNNQGAQLQMYALTKALEEKKCEVYTLTYNKNFDFVDEGIQKRNIITLKSIPYIVKEFLLKKGVKQTYFNFKKYKINKKFRLSNFKYLKYSQANVDATFVGSDEVFSTEVGYNAMMYGHGVDTRKIFSYAPSFGQTNIEVLKRHNVLELVSSGLNKFDKLSARDENTKNIIQELTNKEVTRVCDPVLLYDFSNIKKHIRRINKKYLIVYGYDKNFTDKDEIKAIKKYAKEKGLLTVSVGTYHKWCDKNINCDCLEWIEYFRNCEEVITDTFHGTILSVITNKPMAIFIRKSINQNKLNDLAKILKIDNRIIKEISYTTLNSIFDSKMDYELVNNNLNDLRNKSDQYLDECLKLSKTNNIEELPRKCSGCGACVNICPVGAINYVLNEDGFFEAKIVYSKCIACGLCKKVCYRNTDNKLIDIKNSKLYAANSKSKDIVKKCTSGGIAYEIAKKGIEEGFYVCGVIYNSTKKIAENIVTNNIKDLEKIKGSKYIQSKSDEYINKIIDIIKEQKNAKFIVFGTPCQIAGIRDVVKQKKINNTFYYIDLFCHGVPSYNVFKKYMIENFKNENITDVEFRNKINGWHNYTMKITTNKKLYYKKSEQSDFYKAFFDNALLNESCANCEFRNYKSASDIRLGDFWGNKFKNNNNGVSAVIINTDNGTKVFNTVLDNIELQEIKDIQNCLKYQNNKPYNQNLMKYSKNILKNKKLSKTIKIYRRKMSKKYLIKEKMKEILSYFPSSIKNKFRKI